MYQRLGNYPSLYNIVLGTQQSDPKLTKTAEMQSRKLHAQLTLSLIHTVGPQQALLESGVEDDEDGTMALSRLIKHFEYTTKELRFLELH